MSTTKQVVLAPTDFCMDCGVMFFSANEADKHWKSQQHRYRNIDRAIAKVFPELAQPCPGTCFPVVMRWWL